MPLLYANEIRRSATRPSTGTRRGNAIIFVVGLSQDESSISPCRDDLATSGRALSRSSSAIRCILLGMRGTKGDRQSHSNLSSAKQSYAPTTRMSRYDNAA